MKYFLKLSRTCRLERSKSKNSSRDAARSFYLNSLRGVILTRCLLNRTRCLLNRCLLNKWQAKQEATTHRASCPIVTWGLNGGNRGSLFTQRLRRRTSLPNRCVWTVSNRRKIQHLPLINFRQSVHSQNASVPTNPQLLRLHLFPESIGRIYSRIYSQVASTCRLHRFPGWIYSQDKSILTGST